MNCRLCKSEQLEKIYEGPIRAGGPGSEIEDGFSIYRCGHCEICFLHPIPGDVSAYYQSREYWSTHKNLFDIDTVPDKLYEEQVRWLSEIGLNTFRQKQVADVGCGTGLFLDLISGTAQVTVGVEPAFHFKNTIESKGHLYFRDARLLDKESLDVVVSFDTIEHVERPAELIREMYRALRSGGSIYLGVPNQNDFLKQLVPAYLSFFYHKSHLYYFNANALKNMLEEAGFRDCIIRYVHKYDIMNMVVWARDGIGQGNKGNKLFDASMEASFKMHLERLGQSSHILIEGIKR